MSKYEWDQTKNLSNQKKHGVRFEEAADVFEDPLNVSFLTSHEQGEERWSTIGMTRGCLILLVIHTYRDEENFEVVRLISARRATQNERKRYERDYR